jgi:hypothetical protein
MAYQPKYLSKAEKLQQQKDDLDFLIQKKNKDLARWKGMARTSVVTENMLSLAKEIIVLEKERLALK